MAYNERKMLEDVNGDLIPQYYDPVDDEFKPLTNDPRDVRLTGSNVVDSFNLDSFVVEAGSYMTLIDYSDNQHDSFTIGFHNYSSNDFTLFGRRALDNHISNAFQQTIELEDFGGRLIAWDVPIPTPNRYQIRIRNNTSETIELPMNYLTMKKAGALNG